VAKQRDSVATAKAARSSVGTPATLETPKPAKATKPLRQGELFDKGTATPVGVKVKALRYPAWTESKARLIQSYLRLFTYVTRHGTYIDAFAGPQRVGEHDMWSAKLVLDLQPARLRHWFLFEQDPQKVATLQQLATDYNAPFVSAGKKPRDIAVVPGDSNVEIPKFLASRPIKDREATFALLDQRTFECHWDTVRALATHKTGGNKIELFYFLPNHWLARSIAGLTKNVTTAEKWWRDDWRELSKLKPQARAALFTNRIRDEFGYADVKAWPISERKAGGGSIMYYMIHATDHPAAPILMRRAFERAVDSTRPVDQLTIERLLKDA
jgi:three-Cys-motif partner protein